MTVVLAAWAPFFSGAERALVSLVEGFDHSRYRPVVVVGTKGELMAELQARGITTVHVPLERTGRPGSWSLSVGRLAWLARRERAALIHANDLPSFQPAGYAARALGIPAVAHVRFPDAKDGYEWFLKPGFSRALFISNALRADAVAAAPDLFDRRSEVIYDGVDVPAPVDDAERRRIRLELGLPLDRALVVLAGQVAVVKGIWEYIEAAGLLVHSGVDATFVVLGDDLRSGGALRLEAERAVQERQLADHVRFLGFRRDARSLIPAFDVVAVPSHVEPLGLTVLEGMAASRPVVGTRVGGIPETVVDGVTGLLVPRQDPVALANAIGALVRDRVKARSFGLAGRARVLERFSVAGHVSRVQSVYDRLLRQASRRAMATASTAS